MMKTKVPIHKPAEDRNSYKKSINENKNFKIFQPRLIKQSYNKKVAL